MGKWSIRASSTDLKERLVRAVANDQPVREAARRFEMAVITAKRTVAQERETGSLARKLIPDRPCSRPRAICGEQETILRARLEAAPDAPVLEQGAWWAGHQGQPVSEAAMWRTLRRLGWTHRKESQAASERDEQARTDWRAGADWHSGPLGSSRVPALESPIFPASAGSMMVSVDHSAIDVV